ncbi:NHLP leader peptide family RiPP precursor [Paenibacillus sp. GCM10027628]|uniref:NHLP leader peptide family RiPP precursor n=1 Tax=Paenibacillus sp. GCM10027628 TaxID=3273413 RepID=UPI0036263B2A
MTADQILHAKISQKAWEDASFREKLLSDPKAALKEAFDILIPDHIEIKTVEETANQHVLVIPTNPTNVLDGTSVMKDVW